MSLISLALPLAPALAAVAARLYLGVSETAPSHSQDLNRLRQTKA